MQARFLLGPAGSGKTFRCLADIRAELIRRPDGPPLILLAPKQATFQLERQLLADSGLHGYTRLQILSFDRLARLALDQIGAASPPILSEEGRVMVLRALLFQHAGKLKRFDKSARRPGFAQQLSALLAELQSHGISAARLDQLSQQKHLSDELRAKLHDLKVLLEAYGKWLADHALRDAGYLLEAAVASVKSAEKAPSGAALKIDGLWLDGFAELTPAELDLLAVVLPCCERATLAFCVDEVARLNDDSFSIWRVVGKTFASCHTRIAALPGVQVKNEWLLRDAAKGRFTRNPALAHLEAAWSTPSSFAGNAAASLPRLVACNDHDAEATFAAREVLKFVHAGGRFREIAVLVRQLDGYQKPLERAFRHAGIPFFLDRRESVAHHPLAELTRSALRTVAYDWPHEDWFAALKAGFAPVEESDIDTLENEALARGWHGAKWRAPINLAGDEAELAARLESIRTRVLPPFSRLAERLAAFQFKPTGEQLAEALRDFWQQARIEQTLERWSVAGTASASDCPSPLLKEHSAVHATVWEQMNAWLDNLALAFPREAMSLRDWLPVLEAGLANLTVGVIPPALDQVLIGAVDRSRNPDLKLAFVLGLNERVFPAAPGTPLILTDEDRDALHASKVQLGSDLRDRLARERYFGYIACTRSGERLVTTFARTHEGVELSPSPFVALLQRLFADLRIEEFHHADWREAEFAGELTQPLLETRNLESAARNWEELRKLPTLVNLISKLEALRVPSLEEQLSPALADKLFGPVLQSSVSRLEEFAKCPFRFFVHSGMRAEERKVFELDFREQGSFQHDVLMTFHQQLAKEGKKWRDLTPTAARARIESIAKELEAGYRDGLLRYSPQTQFTTRVMTRALQNFIEVIVDWMRTRYQFDPARVELGFGIKDGELPAWRIDLGGGHTLHLNGRIDRVDLFPIPGKDEALCVVMDYKSSAKKLDPVLLDNGVQLQLLSYLAVLRHCPDAQKVFGVSRLVPAGVFYVNLRGATENDKSRVALMNAQSARKKSYRHVGRFDFAALPQLDASGASTGEQFNFRLRKDGALDARSTDALASAELQELLKRVEDQLRGMGRRIFSGEFQVDPYRKGTSTPCEYCDYQALCRIDPWTHNFRALHATEPTESPEE